MQSKRDKLFLAAQTLGCLTCPVCGAALLRAEDDFACERHHRLNVNRKGCLNVLSSQVDSFYDAALFAARRRVFDAGCYDAVTHAIEAMLPAAPQRILDAGCGDGWYLNALLSRHEDWCGAGVDISRDAILQATNHPCTALWVVGDLRRLPFADGSFTAVLDVLTPANYEEFRRVLTPEGLLIKVYPGSGYLKELRTARELPPYEEGQVDSYLREKAAIVAETRVTVTHQVSDALWRDFVWMTPLMQDLSAAEKEDIATSSARCVTVDLHVAACRLR
ncbi:MAG: methyltransferase domain-containing protein [Clostridiales bacterium]|nr:methyltransferase domain-containing protein [Clostridiales bacterium]